MKFLVVSLEKLLIALVNKILGWIPYEVRERFTEWTLAEIVGIIPEIIFFLNSELVSDDIPGKKSENKYLQYV